MIGVHADVPLKAVHEQRLERWLGADKMKQISDSMKGWYGPPINIRDVAGSVWVDGQGNFFGDFEKGFFGSALDRLSDHVKTLDRKMLEQRGALNVGFASIGDALLRASSGDGQQLNGNLAKIGTTGVIGSCNSLWGVGPSPAAGAAGSAAPGGRAPTKATTGAMAYNNPSSGTLHLTGADFSASVINNSLMLYDRIFDVAKTMNSTAAETVTGVPTRYQSTTATAEDYIGGNFLFMETQTALAATAHNWTLCTYLDQANAASTLPDVVGVSGAIINRFDMPLNTWFAPLASGDVGIKALTNIQCSALVATGAINFVLGHTIGVMAFPIAGPLLPFDWLTNRKLAPRIFDNACLALFELPKPATAATTYNGQIYVTRAAP